MKAFPASSLDVTSIISGILGGGGYDGHRLSHKECDQQEEVIIR